MQSNIGDMRTATFVLQQHDAGDIRVTTMLPENEVVRSSIGWSPALHRWAPNPGSTQVAADPSALADVRSGVAGLQHAVPTLGALGTGAELTVVLPTATSNPETHVFTGAITDTPEFRRVVADFARL